MKKLITIAPHFLYLNNGVDISNLKLCNFLEQKFKVNKY